MSGQRERQPGLHGHPRDFFAPFSVSLGELRGSRGRAGGLTDMGQEAAEVTQECHREGSKGRRRKEVFLSFFFLNFFLSQYFSFLFSVTTMCLELMR